MKVKIAQLCLTLHNPHGLYSPGQNTGVGSLSPGDLRNPHGLYSPGQNTGVGSLSPGDLPNTGIKPRSPTLQVDTLPAEQPGKPKNTGMGSLSLFQPLFLTQESNQGLLLCRQILYQLSYQGSPLNDNKIVSVLFSRNVFCL